MRKKLFTFLLALATSVGMMWAQGPWTSGDCTLTLSGGVMTVSGSGAMADYNNSNPWKSYNSSITSIVIEDGVTHVGNGTFPQCTSLVSVVIGDDVETIGEFTFDDAGASLTSVTMGNKVKSIGMAAFLWDTGLPELILSEDLETIGAYAFCRMEALTTITIPSKVTSIGDAAFSNCSALQSIYIEAATPPTLGDGVFADVNTDLSTIPLYVPNGSVAAYTAADQWNAFDIQGYDPAPDPAPVSPVTAARFLYTYDCQRNPAYPKQGSPCTLRGFSDPYVGYNGIGRDAKNTPFGPWKLEFVANYTPSNDYGCESVVRQAVNQYYSSLSNQEKEAKRLEVPIFRLWQYNIVAGEYQHAAYGIVCAYADEGNAEDHGALFISSSNNGCFLAGKPHNAQISLSCENDLTTGMNNLVTAASATDPDYDAYMPVILSIDAIGTVELTQHCKDFIEGSSSAYNALTDAQKGQVTNYQVLVDAKNQWDPLVAEAKPYADAVVDLINAIPNPIVYTQSCQNKIDAAQNAYDALTSGQKMFVSNYETLKNAPFDLINAAPYVHILFKANGKEKKVENVTLPRVFTEAEMKTMLKEMHGVEGDYDLYAYIYDDAVAAAVDISGGKWTINPFMGKVDVNGDLNKFDPETGDMDMISFSLEISLELPPYESEPLADCGLGWLNVPEGGVVGTIGHEDEIQLPQVNASQDFILAYKAGTVSLRLGSTDKSVLAVYGFNNFAVNGVGECDVYVVHDEDAVFAYDSAAFHVTVNPEQTVWTALKVGDVIKVGDKIEVPAEGDGSWGINGNVLRNAWGPYELIRADIYQPSEFDDPVVTEDAGGAFYVFKAENSNFYPLSYLGKSGGLVVTATSDGLVVTAAENKEFTVAVHENGSIPTAVENVQTNHVQATKFFRDGQLLIEKNGKTYNVVGTVVR